MKKLILSLALCLFTNPAAYAAPDDQQEFKNGRLLKAVLAAELEGNSVTLGTSDDLPFKEENFSRTWSAGGLFNVSSKGQAFEIALEYIDLGWLQDAIWILDQTGHYKYAEQTLSDVLRLIRSPKVVGQIKDIKPGETVSAELRNNGADGAQIPPVEATRIEDPSEVLLHNMLYQFDRYFGLNIVPAVTLKHIPKISYDDNGENRVNRLFSITLPVENLGYLDPEHAKKLKNADRLAFLADVFDLDITEPELIGQKRTKGLFLSRTPQIKRTSFLTRLVSRTASLVAPAGYTSELKVRILNSDLEEVKTLLSPMGKDAERILQTIASIKKRLSPSQDKIAYRPYTTEQRLLLKNDSARTCESVLSLDQSQRRP